MVYLILYTPVFPIAGVASCSRGAIDDKGTADSDQIAAGEDMNCWLQSIGGACVR